MLNPNGASATYKAPEQIGWSLLGGVATHVFITWPTIDTEGF